MNVIQSGSGKTGQFLEDSGVIDAVIPAGDWNPEGYLQCARNKHGQVKLWGNDISRGPVLEFKPWPKGFDYDAFLTIFNENVPPEEPPEPISA